MLAVRTARRRVAELCRKAWLIEQPGCLIDELIKVMEDEYLIADGEEVGHGGTELGEHRGARSRSLEEPSINAFYLCWVHGIEHADGRPEGPSFILPKDAAARVQGTQWRIAEPAWEAAPIQLQRDALGAEPFKQSHPTRVHGGRDGEVRISARRDQRPMPPRVACLRQVIDGEVKECPEALHYMWLFEEDPS